jgi:hypothetical protein
MYYSDLRDIMTCISTAWKQPFLPSHGRGHWFDPSIAHHIQLLSKFSSLHFKLHSDNGVKAGTLSHNKPQDLESTAVIRLNSYPEPGGFHDANNSYLFSRRANTLRGLDSANDSHY